MSDIQTRHYNDKGEQHTERVVTVTDAKGDSYQHVWAVTDDGHEYMGEGQPPDSAQEAIEAFEDSEDSDV